ncbi:MAG: glycoside hydrolase family 25 protein [Anaerolineae bacterium]
MIQGFDVSRYQAGIDMAAARQAGMRFVFVRASIGAEADWACGQHLYSAQGLLARGTYHALLPEVPPAVQAVTYYASLAASGGFLVELPPVLDVEKAGLDETMARRFLDELERLWQRRPLIYTSESKWHKLVGRDRAWARDYQLWVAHWNVPEPRLPTPWTEWAFWQYTVDQVPFWPRKLDLDLFRGNEQELWRL